MHGGMLIKDQDVDISRSRKYSSAQTAVIIFTYKQKEEQNQDPAGMSVFFKNSDPKSETFRLNEEQWHRFIFWSFVRHET